MMSTWEEQFCQCEREGHMRMMLLITKESFVEDLFPESKTKGDRKIGQDIHLALLLHA